MTASDFAGLLRARRVGRGKWSALCPAHGDRNRSLSISEGKRRPILFRCMSQNCPPESILEAMGMTWADVLGERAVTPEIRQKLRDEKYMAILKNRWMAIEILKVTDFDNRAYWAAAELKIDEEIQALRTKMDPQLNREIKMKAAIQRHGWTAIWEKFLETPKGRSLSERYSIGCASSTTLSAPATAKEAGSV